MLDPCLAARSGRTSAPGGRADGDPNALLTSSEAPPSDRRACRAGQLPTVKMDPRPLLQLRPREPRSWSPGGDGGRRLAGEEPIDRSPTMKVARSVAEVLAEHTTLTLECIDRMYLNVYVPLLQRAAGAAYFFRKMRGAAVPSSALMAPMTQRFVDAIKSFATRNRIEIVSFRRGERKDDRTAAVPPRLAGRRGRPLHRQGPGEGAGGAHRAPPRPHHRRHLPVAGRLDGDGQPVLLLRRGRRLRSVLPEVLFVLPLQRQAVHQRARVPEAATDEAGASRTSRSTTASCAARTPNACSGWPTP